MEAEDYKRIDTIGIILLLFFIYSIFFQKVGEKKEKKIVKTANLQQHKHYPSLETNPFPFIMSNFNIDDCDPWTDRAGIYAIFNVDGQNAVDLDNAKSGDRDSLHAWFLSPFLLHLNLSSRF